MTNENNPRKRRVSLIEKIEKKRSSRVITFITSDRLNATSQIAGDSVRPMYKHLRELGFDGVDRIDLFLYSQGGHVDVPWRIVTMLREYCQDLNILVPFKAHSAATLIALGADSIVMGKKGELSPIDPILTRTEQKEQTIIRDQMSVEDVMAFISFMKERAGLGDQAAISQGVSLLAEMLKPWTLGSVYRTHSHIRLIAHKLLTSHRNNLEERQIETIIETLAEKMYFHGHAIGRDEAEDIGLNVIRPEQDLDDLMWQLFDAYADLLKLDEPVDPEEIIPSDLDIYEEAGVILACIESNNRFDAFEGKLVCQRIRNIPPNLNVNLNLSIQLPPSLDPKKLPQQAQDILQKILENAQKQVAPLIHAEIKKQAPVQRTEVKFRGYSWRNLTDKGV